MPTKDPAAIVRDRLQGAIALIGRRLAERPGTRRRDPYERLSRNLTEFRRSFDVGIAPPVGSGLGFGAGLALSEWDFEEEEIVRAVREAETLYRDGVIR